MKKPRPEKKKRKRNRDHAGRPKGTGSLLPSRELTKIPFEEKNWKRNGMNGKGEQEKGKGLLQERKKGPFFSSKMEDERGNNFTRWKIQ